MTRRVTMHDIEGDIKAKMGQTETAAEEAEAAAKKTVRQSLLVIWRFTFERIVRELSLILNKFHLDD